ncbi:BppU family phage baseplate upper protein [Clostridium baratii]|uniref:BppU family phage baseplate upper protein n=1 Tax=Clostridium baratii TaxID=1561 RepID=UPI0030D05DB2
MELLKKVTLEINKEVNRNIKAKQNDTARYLLFTIVDNGVPFSLQGKEVKIFAVKPDGKLVYNACQITNSTNGETKLNLTSQMLAVPGTLKAELVISEGNNILSTIPFEIEVIKSLRDDSALESTNEFSILLSKINEGQTLEESISELITEGKPLYNKLNPVVEAGKELNTSLPPKTSEADRILKQLLQAIQNGNLDNFISRNKDIFTGHNGNYSGVPIVSSDGVMEVGKYIDFHLPGSDKDYDGRVMIDETKIYHNGSEIYSTTNKPTPADIGAFPTTGGTITGYTKFETEYIDIGIGEERLIRIGVGPTDMYICNLKTNKYLQLKDTGILSYSNKEICDKGHFVANTGLNGYQMLPSGLCLQWGYVEMGSASTKVINFPKAYVDNNYVFVPGVYGGPGRVPSIKSYYAKNSNISIQSESGFSAYWIAIGRV